MPTGMNPDTTVPPAVAPVPVSGDAARPASTSAPLAPVSQGAPGPGAPDAARRLRLRRPNRDQVAPVPAYLDALLPPDHLARLLWEAIEHLDLRAFAADLVVVEEGPGRSAAFDKPVWPTSMLRCGPPAGRCWLALVSRSP